MKKAISAVLVLILCLSLCACGSANQDQPEIITVSTLEKIINIDELSTFTAVYNGVAEVMSEKNPDKVDYYVSYNAKVNAGIDFEDISITVSEDTKEVTIHLPEVRITDISVDLTSLDFIFINDKANTSSVSKTAYEQCQQDVESETESHAEILKLAQENAKSILTALTEPIIKQLDAEYTLTVN